MSELETKIKLLVEKDISFIDNTELDDEDDIDLVNEKISKYLEETKEEISKLPFVVSIKEPPYKYNIQLENLEDNVYILCPYSEENDIHYFLVGLDYESILKSIQNKIEAISNKYCQSKPSRYELDWKIGSELHDIIWENKHIENLEVVMEMSKVYKEYCIDYAIKNSYKVNV